MEERTIKAINNSLTRLFQQMKEAGYEWDAEKKELKKIEPKTLDADKVIAWLKNNLFDDIDDGHFWSDNRNIIGFIEQFKKDFEI